MEDNFFKFPSTPHLTVLGEMDIRGDKVMTEGEREEFLHHKLVVEEKVDGANIGISFGPSGEIRVQNRGEYLVEPYCGQWKRLAEWLNPRTDFFFDRLGDRYILFGEWCYAQHSAYYERLPDWFLGFDIFDKIRLRFFSCRRRDAMLLDLKVYKVPHLKEGYFSLAELQGLFSTSLLGDVQAEGLYLRWDSDDWLEKRAKLVRPTFLQSIADHWSQKNIRANRLQVENRT
ncbi:MAG: RNA ligase family protein [Syntrophobacteraceae bacterium]|nr:RNA ligase family protein [Syntrophobacteraceae bacterium]